MDQRWKARWTYDLRFRLVLTTGVAGLVGVVMGLVLAISLWGLRDSFGALEKLDASGVLDRDWQNLKGEGGPDMLLVIVAALGGWCGAWVAERVLGACGSVVWIPVFSFTGVAVGTGMALCRWLIPSHAAMADGLLLESAVILLLGAGAEIYLRDLLRSG